eukprot:GEMP01016942.1.p1 GENE.GEMP01016942.1~~GEMP01016942.1.p1  ORF type:complete len:776 (+),score=205.93 GEMP01016942.1:254-2581(+)
MLSHADLLRKCIEIIESFNPKKTTVDAHYSDSGVISPEMALPEKKFIHQVLYGCVRYANLLKVFVHSFLYKNPATAPWSDQTVYLVLGYLLLFRLEELGVDDFRQFIFAGLSTSSALNDLLIFCFSEDDLVEWCKEAWCKIYDVAFIEQDIIGNLHSYRQQMQPLMNEISFTATGKIEETSDTATDLPQQKRKCTVPRPFKLTKPKPRLIPEPTAIDRVIEAKPVSKTIYETSLSEIDAEKERRREELREKTKTKYTKEQEFKLLTAERPGADDMVKDQFRTEMERVNMEECTFVPQVNPGFNRHALAETEVKMNTAAILREDKLIRNKQEKEYEILKNYESEMQDASEFYRWQQDMREKDTMEEAQRVAQRKVEMQMCRSEAIEASASQVRRNHMIAQREKFAISDALNQKAKEHEKELVGKQLLVSDVMLERTRVRVAEEKVKDDKDKIGAEVRALLKKEFEQKKASDEHEMERKKDLIHQIRAYERVPGVAKQAAAFDPCEPPRHGCMEEMSLAELRERLRMVTEAAERDRARLHDDILSKKDDKKRNLEQKLEGLKKIRNLAHTDAQLRRERLKTKKADEERQKEELREQRYVEVTAKIDAKQRARAMEERRLKQELKEISTRRQFDDLKTGKDSATLTQEDVQRGQERYNQMLERKGDAAALASKVSRLRDTKIRQENRRQVRRDFRSMQHEVEDRLEASRKELAIRKEDLRNENKDAFKKQKDYETMLQHKRVKVYPCEAKMKQLTITTGREYRELIEKTHRTKELNCE